jgi:hypothetical protein
MGKRIRTRSLWQHGFARDLAALALLLVLCLLFFWRLVTPSPTDRGSFRQGDFYDQFYAFAVFEHDQLSQGQLPLWNPYTFSGHPFLADVQSAIFYPLSLLTILLSTSQGFSALALEWEAIAHFYLAAVFTYLFARRLLRNRVGALISAVAFAFGGYLTSYPALQLAVLETVIWLPLILLLIDLGVTELSSYRKRLAFLYLLLAGLVLGIAILAGHPQSAMYVAYVSILYYFFRIWYVKRQTSSRIAIWLIALGLAVFVLAGFGLSAAQVLPSWEFMQLSSRPDLGYQELSGGFSPLDLVQMLLPHATGFWSPLYVGIFPLLLALFALYLLVRGAVPVESTGQRQRWQAEIAFWAIVAGVALLLTLGDDSFLYSLFYLFAPGFGLFRAQERAAIVFSLALSLLAGYGFTALVSSINGPQGLEQSTRAFFKLVVGLGLGIGALIILSFFGRSTAGTPPASSLDAMLSLGIFVALLLGGSLLWLLVWKRHPEKWLLSAGLALFLILLDLFTVNSRPNVQKRKIENQFRATGVIRELQAQPGKFRVHNEWRLPGNYGDVFGLEDTWGASPLRLASYERFVDQVPQERAWELLNVRYVVTWLDDLSAPSEPVYEEPTKKGEVTYIHELEGEHPRIWIVYQTEVVSREDEMLDRIAQPDFDPYGVALLAEPLRSSLGGQPASKPQVGLVPTSLLGDSSPSHLVVNVDQEANGLLIFSEIYYPGWQARVDGHEVPLLQADAILRAVEVPAGQHQVEMTFNPPSVKLGLAISAATLLLSLAYCLWCGIRCFWKPINQ